MKKILYTLLITSALYQGAKVYAQGEMLLQPVISDGPYIFFRDNLLNARWIRNDVLKETQITEAGFPLVNKKLKLNCSYGDLVFDYSSNPDLEQIFNNIDSIAVITDLHGEYKTYIKLLKSNGIIGKDLGWTFGKGHLVILGDIFDRGEKVTEILWHLFGLEKQAKSAGGMVHIMLGNHEFMIMDNDLTYTNPKYRKTELILKTDYSDLFSQNTVLGKWLRSKPVALTINRMLFIHGGLSVELVRKGISIGQINKTFSDKLNGKIIPGAEEALLNTLEDPDNDPLWYRGYFTDRTFNRAKLDSILAFYSIEKILVGHTSFDKMISIYDNKIIGVDAGITNHNAGEMFIYKQGCFYRGLPNGKRLIFKM